MFILSISVVTLVVLSINLLVKCLPNLFCFQCKLCLILFESSLISVLRIPIALILLIIVSRYYMQVHMLVLTACTVPILDEKADILEVEFVFEPL
jgi:hypothetical protein